MLHSPFLFPRERLHDVGSVIGRSLATRLAAPIFALHVGTWHVHLVVGIQPSDVPAAAKCMKDAVRYGLEPGRPIWTDGYDKRYCFDEASLRSRIRYVERHNEALGWGPRPWGFVSGWECDPSTPISPRSVTGG